MKILFNMTAIVLALALSACGSGGNLRSAGEYNAPPAPALTHPYYSPYAAYGDERGKWRPEVVDRDKRLIRPQEPATDYDRADYEGIPWAVGLAGALVTIPGTF